MLAAVTATRYLTPLREGGSLPGIMEADDLGTYVVKFSGAGQGRKALVAEVIAGELGRALGLPVPQLVTVELDPILAMNEPDEEVQDLLRASPGLNLGVDFLPGALDLDTNAFTVDAEFAGRVLWFDGLITNVDRSWRNPNMLFWHGQPYLIDHGASLPFHHRWPAPSTQRGYDAREHALLQCSPDLDSAEAAFASRVTPDLLREVIGAIPDPWIAGEHGFDSVGAVRKAYQAELTARFDNRAAWLADIRTTIIDQVGVARAEPPRKGSNRPRWLGGDS